MMALRTTTGHPGLNTSLLVGATFWVLLAAFSLDVRDYLQQPPLLTGMSHFQGPIQELGPGSFIIRGNAAQPSVAYTEIQLTPNVGYFLEIELKGSPQVQVDFFAGPGYDSIQQEVIFQAGKKGGTRTRYLYSGSAPARALFRIFFEDREDVLVQLVALHEVRESYRRLQALLVGLSILCLGLFSFLHRDRLLVRALSLGSVFFLFYWFTEAAVTDDLADNQWYIPTSFSLLRHGDLDLSEYIAYGLTAEDYRIFESNGRLYNFFPVGTALVSAPIALLGRFIFSPTAHAIDLSLQVSALAAAILAATAVALLYVLLCRMTGRWRALSLAVVFGLATQHFSTHGGNLWSHNAVLPFLLFALIGLRSERAGLSAIPLTIAVLIRPDAVLVLVLSLLYVWIFRRSERARFLISGCLSGFLILVTSRVLYGSIIPPYYKAGAQLSLEHFGEALLGHLISPNRGLFVFTPIFLLSLYGLYRALRFKSRERRFYGLLGAMILAHWITISLFPHWWGGHSYGPRLFSPMLPAFVLLLVPALEGLDGMTGTRRLRIWSLAGLLLASSLFVQYQGASERGVLEWNFTPDVDSNPERVWDWSDMQILRGFGSHGHDLTAK